MRTFRLAKSKKILVNTYQTFKRKKKKLNTFETTEVENDLKALQLAIMQRNRQEATLFAKKCKQHQEQSLKKGLFEQGKDFIFALIFALVIALLIRQLWFELYEIPTGSMRPTFKEEDRLIVSKNTFGINFPFNPGHFYFDPKLVKRLGTFVFTVENMDIREPNTLYFYIFPGKKQFVKRMMGKPGDIVYFYGGQIYGIDKEGNDISKEFQLPELSKIDHVPFIRFEGNVGVSDPMTSMIGEIYRSVIIYQMNEPVAHLSATKDLKLSGQMLNLSHIHSYKAQPPMDYGDLWGINNFATAKLLSRKQLASNQDKTLSAAQESEFFLELKHHPSLKSLKLRKDQFNRLRPTFQLNQSIIPLNESHLRILFDHLYTARFVVKNGVVSRYTVSKNKISDSPFLPNLSNVPNGCYEFFDGKAYQVLWGGITKQLSKNHPLYQFNPERVQLFFNLGIDFDTRHDLEIHSDFSDTMRFAYFRDGDLYVIGAKFLLKNDPVLIAFIDKEKMKSKASTMQNYYQPFVDLGPPLKDGKIDVEKMRQQGLLIPPRMYLALGDNYAMSSDSRDFGFVPEGNLRGSPSFIFWPFASRWGVPQQPPYSWFTFPRITIWIIAIIAAIIWNIYHRKKYRLPLKL